MYSKPRGIDEACSPMQYLSFGRGRCSDYFGLRRPRKSKSRESLSNFPSHFKLDLGSDSTWVDCADKCHSFRKEEEEMSEICINRQRWSIKIKAKFSLHSLWVSHEGINLSPSTPPHHRNATGHNRLFLRPNKPSNSRKFKIAIELVGISPTQSLLILKWIGTEQFFLAAYLSH